MRVIINSLVFFMLSGCASPPGYFIPSDTKSITVQRSPTINAFQYINYNERTHRKELKELTGVDPRRTEWCAAFVNAVLKESGIENNDNHEYPLLARSFLDWGVAVKNPEPGDVVVFPRGNQGWQGHVGFFVKETEINGIKYYYILGGNQSNKVSIEMYRAKRVLGIRRSVI